MFDVLAAGTKRTFTISLEPVALANIGILAWCRWAVGSAEKRSFGVEQDTFKVTSATG